MMDEAKIVRLTKPDKVRWLKDKLDDGEMVACIFCAAGTRFEMFIWPVSRAIGSAEIDGTRTMVAIPNLHASFHFELTGMIHFTYPQEKLKLLEGDAYNITALLNALGHPDGPEYFLERVKLSGDRVEDPYDMYVKPKSSEAA
jgi:hypothetical protein